MQLRWIEPSANLCALVGNSQNNSHGGATHRISRRNVSRTRLQFVQLEHCVETETLTLSSLPEVRYVIGSFML